MDGKSYSKKEVETRFSPERLKHLHEKLCIVRNWAMGKGDGYKCPITLEKMNDPVVTVDGHAYERQAIQDHFANPNSEYRSPFTNAYLPSTKLMPNLALRKSYLKEGILAFECVPPEPFVDDLEGRWKELKDAELKRIKKMYPKSKTHNDNEFSSYSGEFSFV